MGKSTPQAPTPPDPAATAAAQEQTNVGSAIAQANLNRIDQYTPQGSLTYQQTGTNPDGTPKFQQTQAYSPDQQKIYDQNNQVTTQLNDLALNNIGRVSDAQATPFSYDGMTPMQTSVPTSNLTTNVAVPQLQQSFSSGNPVQSALDFSNATALPGTGDFSADSTKAQNAAYDQATSRLDPQFAQQQSALATQMANSGIPVGSAAWNTQMDALGRTKTDAYNQATYSSIAAGSTEQSRLYNEQLSARQQGVNETTTQGTFANSAQQQAFDQSQQQAQFGNDAASQIFGMNSSNAALNNTAANQSFNENLTNANLNNASRQQQIQEATYLRNLPLNDIASLLGTGSGVQNPTFSNVSQVGVAAPDYQGAVYQNYNAQNSQYNQQVAANAQMLGSIFGAAGSIGGAAVMSDIRLKHDIKRIGSLANGLATYVFSYIGDTARHFGVMAQHALQIVPEAVIKCDNGYFAVDYRKVY